MVCPEILHGFACTVFGNLVLVPHTVMISTCLVHQEEEVVVVIQLLLRIAHDRIAGMSLFLVLFEVAVERFVVHPLERIYGVFERDVAIAFRTMLNI